MTPESKFTREKSLREKLEASPADWDTRLQMACLLYEEGDFHEASTLIWETDVIPYSYLGLACAACILATDQPGKAIRLLAAVLEKNRGKAEQNIGMANALLQRGMVLQSARFYGAALETNPELVNPELEHFILWTDDEQSLWGDFNGRRSQLGELPWMTRDAQEALELTSRASEHTTPIEFPMPLSEDSRSNFFAAMHALRETLSANSGDWPTRQKLAQLLYDRGEYAEAAVLIWDSDSIPSIDIDLAFAARIVARDQPRKAIRLLTTILEQDRGKAVQNIGMANALMHHGMVLQAARFYGAAFEVSPNLVNPDLEYFILWTDNEKFLWENFIKNRRPLGTLPWTSSDPMLDPGIKFEISPIVLADLKETKGEKLIHSLYQQSPQRNARITPPPAITVSANQVALKYRRFDSSYGATTAQEAKLSTYKNPQPLVKLPPLASPSKPKTLSPLPKKLGAQVKSTSATSTKALEEAKTKKNDAEKSAKIIVEKAHLEAEAKAAALTAEAAQSVKSLIERARQEATSEIAAIHAKAEEDLKANIEHKRQEAEKELAAMRESARAEAETARLKAAAIAKARAEEDAMVLAQAKHAAEEEAKLAAEKTAAVNAAAKKAEIERIDAEKNARIIVEKARLEAEEKAASLAAEAAQNANFLIEKARLEASSEIAAIHAKAQKELDTNIEQKRYEAEQELAAMREKARAEAAKEAETERLKAAAVAKARAEEEAIALANARRFAESEAKSSAERAATAQVAAKKAEAERIDAEKNAQIIIEKARLEAEEKAASLAAEAAQNAKSLIERARQEASSDVAAIHAKAQKELEANIDQKRYEAEQELAAMKEKARAEVAKEAETARLKAAAVAKAHAEEEATTLAQARRIAELEAKSSAKRAAAAQAAAKKAETEKNDAEKNAKSIVERARLEAEAKAASLAAEAAKNAKSLIERARKETTAEVATIRANAQKDLKANIQKTRQEAELELAAMREEARKESKTLVVNALKKAASATALTSSKFKKDTKSKSTVVEWIPPKSAAVAVVKTHSEELPKAGKTGKFRLVEKSKNLRFGVLLICATVATGCWKFLPGTEFDRVLFSTVTRSFSKASHFISGNGTHSLPWALNSITPSLKPDQSQTPVVISLSDDPGNFFQSSPPSPVDFAVILKNLRRMDRDSLAIGMPLSWDDPDVIALTALDQQLDSIPSLITSAPLTRTSAPTSIPQAFRRASVSLRSIIGKTSLLPHVNRISIPNVVLGNKSSLAGFTTLESEESTEFLHLLARWDDRAVLSFHLLAALNQLHIKPSEITIRLGEWISLGIEGPFIPIDQYGRLTIHAPEPTVSVIPAEALIDAPDDFIAANQLAPILIRDSLSAVDPGTMSSSDTLVSTFAMLSNLKGVSESRSFPRPPWYAELLLIASLLSLIYSLGNYPPLSGKRPLLILAGVIFILHFFLVHATSTWIPTIPLLACILAAIPFTKKITAPKIR